MKKDVQRTFVLLRQCGSGRESGYARAELREGRVKLNLVVQGFNAQEEPYAFAVTQEGLLLIGPLNLDTRGQGGIAAEISLEDLRAMQVLFVANRDGDAVNIPLAGTVGRGGWVDWSQVRVLVAEALLPQREAEKSHQESREEARQQAPAVAESKPDEQTPEMQEPNGQEDAEETQPEEEPSCAAEEEKQSVPLPLEETMQETAEEEIDLYDLPAQESSFEAVERELRTPLPIERRLEMPAALRNAYWPQLLWPLHDLFERFEQVHPFADEQGAVYIRVPLGDKWGRIDHYLVGASVREGWVTGVGYLIPGQDGASAPAGLSGYEWKDGYWQAWQYVENE